MSFILHYSDIKQLALHRFKNAELSNSAAIIPNGFILQNYIDRGGFDYPIDNNSERISLKLKVTSFIKQLLHETPICPEQRISEIDEEHYLIEATVNNTEQLHWWIHSFGSRVEVLEPLKLREQFVQESQRLQAMYRPN